MPRRRLTLIAIVVALGLLWAPVLKPLGQATILMLDVFSEGLLGRNLARVITPEPRVRESVVEIGGRPMRVSWWHPGWGTNHPGILIVPGASPEGNDHQPLRDFSATIARAGYLVMLPELPFLKEGRFDVDGPRQIDAAFAHLRAAPETRGRAAGTFGISVGGGAMLVGAGQGGALRDAAFLSVLGAYYDIDTYLASVASRSQLREGRLVPWVPSDEARQRLPTAAVDAAPESDRDSVRAALAETGYEAALSRIRALPAATRDAYERLSPRAVWPRIAAPVFWIHDPNDTFEPVAEAEAAAAAPREARTVVVVPRLISHAVAATDEAKAQGPLFVLGELWRLLAFTFEVLRLAG